MKTFFTKKLAVICLSAVMVLGLGVSVATLGKANAESQKIEIDQIESQYAFNSVLGLEDRLLNVEVDGKKYAIVDIYFSIDEDDVAYKGESIGSIFYVCNRLGFKEIVWFNK